MILRAFSERLSQYLPTARTHSTGCNTFGNHRSDAAHGRGIHDLLLPPKKEYGQCLAPTDDSSEIQWMPPHSTLEDYEDLEGLPNVEDVWEGRGTITVRQSEEATERYAGEGEIDILDSTTELRRRTADSQT